jgi:hypothetical protein
MNNMYAADRGRVSGITGGLETHGGPRIGYAYVKPQQLGKVYPPRRALAEGTIFPELNISMHDYTRGIRHETQR